MAAKRLKSKNRKRPAAKTASGRKARAKNIRTKPTSPSPPAPGATAPEASAIKRSSAPESDEIKIARGVALPAMHDAKRREEWGLPEDPRKPGYYMVELNLRHPDGLDGAATAFEKEVYAAVVKDPNRRPERITS